LSDLFDGSNSKLPVGSDAATEIDHEKSSVHSPEGCVHRIVDFGKLCCDGKQLHLSAPDREKGQRASIYQTLSDTVKAQFKPIRVALNEVAAGQLAPEDRLEISRHPLDKFAEQEFLEWAQNHRSFPKSMPKARMWH